METLRLTLFGVGTVAFLVNVFLAVKYPEFVEAPISESQNMKPEPEFLKEFQGFFSYATWTSWGLSAFITFLDQNGYLAGFNF